MTIEASSAAATQERQGKVYHFCSTHCASKFNSAPERYVAVSPGRTSLPNS
jgi:Cu+-exporting ATPase